MRKDSCIWFAPASAGHRFYWSRNFHRV